MRAPLVSALSLGLKAWAPTDLANLGVAMMEELDELRCGSALQNWSRSLDKMIPHLLEFGRHILGAPWMLLFPFGGSVTFLLWLIDAFTCGLACQEA